MQNTEKRILIGFNKSTENPSISSSSQNNETNLYLVSIIKAFQDFLDEEKKGLSFTENRLVKKIEYARDLFKEDWKKFKK